MTDPHVHLRDWNQSSKETVLHGLGVAFEAGFDHVFDMPNTNPAITSRLMVEKRLEFGIAAENALKGLGKEIHYHLYCGLTEDKEQIAEMVACYKQLFPRVCALKLFASQSTGNMGIIGKPSQLGIYKALAELGYDGVLAVHCEKEELFDKGASCHSLVRPSVSEVQSVVDQIECATESGFRGTLHIAHVSTQGALDAIRNARKEGKIRITCGATPHHALFNRSSESVLLKMNPPLREESDRLAIYSGLFDGTIDWVESDHAPHTLSDKTGGASGIPGFEGMLVLIRRLRDSGMSESRLEQLFCTNALKAFRIEASCSPVPEITSSMLEAAHKAYPFSVWS